MQKYSNNLVLCFVNGEPHLFNKLLKEYNKLSILPDEAFEIIKKDINFENLSSMPSMTKVWNSLAISLGASHYSYTFNKNDGEIPYDSFEEILIKKIEGFGKTKLFLCFVNGDPFLYNTWIKKYTKYEISVEEAIDIIKEHVSLIKTQAPSETEIFNVLSVALGKSGYNRNYNKGKNSLYPNSFKNNVYKEISLYFSELYNNNVLCFVDGEAYTFNKFSKVYTKYNISVNEAMEIIKNNISLSNVRPGINDIMQILAKNIGCIGYRWQFNKKNSIPRKDSFENILLKNITKFLDELYPPEERDELLKKKHEYDNNLRRERSLSASYAAKRAEREIFMKKKSGRRLY
jgi:hypothetical protein